MQSSLWKVALVATCVLCLSAGALEAQAEFGIAMDVSCDDAETRSLVRSFFSRELRELGDDVRVGKVAAPDYQLGVVAEKVGGHGWVLSVVISSLLDTGSLEGLDAETAASLGGYGQMIVHSLSRGDSSHDLGREIAQIAKNFDSEVLKPRRKEMKKK